MQKGPPSTLVEVRRGRFRGKRDLPSALFEVDGGVLQARGTSPPHNLRSKRAL